MADPVYIQKDPLTSAFDGLSRVAQGYLDAEQTLRDRYEADRTHALRQDSLNEQVRQFDSRQGELIRQFDLSFEEDARKFDEQIGQAEEHFTRDQDFRGEQRGLDRESTESTARMREGAATHRMRMQIEAGAQARAQELRASSEMLDLVESLGDRPLDTVVRDGLPAELNGRRVDPDNRAQVIDYLKSIQGEESSLAPEGEENNVSLAIASHIYDLEHGTRTPREAMAAIASFRPGNVTVERDPTVYAMIEQVAIASTVGSQELWDQLSEEQRQSHLAGTMRLREQAPALRQTNLRNYQQHMVAKGISEDQDLSRSMFDPISIAHNRQGLMFGSSQGGYPVMMTHWNGNHLAGNAQRTITDSFVMMENSFQDRNRPTYIEDGTAEDNAAFNQWAEMMNGYGRMLDNSIPSGDISSGSGDLLANYFIETARGDRPQFVPPRPGGATTPAPRRGRVGRQGPPPASGNPRHPRAGLPSITGGPPSFAPPPTTTPTPLGIGRSVLAEGPTPERTVTPDTSDKFRFDSRFGHESYDDLQGGMPQEAYINKHGRAAFDAAVAEGLIVPGHQPPVTPRIRSVE